MTAHEKIMWFAYKIHKKLNIVENSHTFIIIKDVVLNRTKNQFDAFVLFLTFDYGDSELGAFVAEFVDLYNPNIKR